MMRRAELLLDIGGKPRLGQRAAVVPAALMEERRAVRHPGAFLAKAKPDQDARGVRADVDAGADFAEQARLLVDLHVEAGLQQADRGGEPADAAADDGDPDVARAPFTRRACRAPGRSPRPRRPGRRRRTARAAASSAPAPDRRGYAPSSAFTPETSGLPSNSLRMVTAASSAALSPLLQASWQRSELRLAVAEMQPAKAPARASSSTASVEGNTSKLFEIAAASRA